MIAARMGICTILATSVAAGIMFKYICVGLCGSSDSIEAPPENKIIDASTTSGKYGTNGVSNATIANSKHESLSSRDSVITEQVQKADVIIGKAKQETVGTARTTEQPRPPRSQTPVQQHAENVKRFCEEKYGQFTPPSSKSSSPRVSHRNQSLSPALVEKTMTGSQLHATFQILRKIAQTNSGTVFRAQNRTTKEIVAIKVHHKRGKNAAFVYNEAKLQAELSHPNIVSLLGFADLRDDVYIVQQYCGGGELFDAVKPDIGCSTDLAREYMLQLGKAIQYLHTKGVAHRDIKPENIMLTEDKKELKIIDFGLSEKIREKGARYKRHVGTVPYMAAELWRNCDDAYVELDLEAIDVWAAGVVLYCLSVGRFPWAEATARSAEYRRFIDGDFTQGPWVRIEPAQLELIKNMLHVDPAQRWTITEVVTYIETKWRPLSPPSANKLAARASLRVDTRSANSAPSSPKDGYLTLSPCPEITRFVFDEMINELHHGAEQPAAVPPGA